MAADNDGSPLGKAATIGWSDITSIKEDTAKVSIKNAYAESTGYSEEKDLPDPPPVKKKKGHTDNSPSRMKSIQNFKTKFGFPTTKPKKLTVYDKIQTDKRFEPPTYVNQYTPRTPFNQVAPKLVYKDAFGGIGKTGVPPLDAFGGIQPKSLKSNNTKSKKKNGGIF
jgi:hypothetical protein